MLHVSIHSIEKTLFEGDADSVTLPGVDGELGILPLHLPLISSLKRGTINIHQGREVLFIEIKGGFAEVRPGSQVVVLAN